MFSDAEVLDTSTEDFCKNSKSDACQTRQVKIRRKVAGDLPSDIIFEFSRSAELNSIIVMVAEAELYTPQHLGIIFHQIKTLITSEHGKPLGETDFSLTESPRSSSKRKWYNGHGVATWHTKDSIIKVNLSVIGAESEAMPTKGSVLYIHYLPLKLFSSES